MARGPLSRLASRVRTEKLWEAIRASFWVVPALMIVAAGALSTAVHRVDDVVALDELVRSGWLYGSGPEGAREILSTIAGSMITIAGVVFSITVVVLTLASSQFGSRLLRQFMDDRGNQLVLGTFTATFLYCLLGLRVVDATGEEPYVPHLTVTVGVVLAVASLGVLIYFIHHMASSIQAPRVVERAGQEMDRVVRRIVERSSMEEDERGDPGPDDPESLLSARFADEALPIRSDAVGYVQGVDVERLVEVAVDRGLVVRVLRDSGSYVIGGSVLALAWPREAADAEAGEIIAGAFLTGHRRTPVEDLVHAFGQLTEIAVRGLSPSINDPFTARTCIFRSSAGLARILECGEPPWTVTDEEGNLRVVRPPVTFGHLVETTWDPIRRQARESLIVLEAILGAVEELTPRVRSDAQKGALRRQVELVVEHARHAIHASERASLEARVAALSPSLEELPS